MGAKAWAGLDRGYLSGAREWRQAQCRQGGLRKQAPDYLCHFYQKWPDRKSYDGRQISGDSLYGFRVLQCRLNYCVWGVKTYLVLVAVSLHHNEHA